MRDSAREVLRHLVLEVGLPVTGDPETLAICQRGRAEVRSLKQLARRAVWRLPRMAKETPAETSPAGFVSSEIMMIFKDG